MWAGRGSLSSGNLSSLIAKKEENEHLVRGTRPAVETRSTPLIENVFTTTKLSTALDTSIGLYEIKLLKKRYGFLNRFRADIPTK